MASTIRTFIIAAIVIVVILLFGSYFTVRESHRAIVMRMGKLITNSTNDKPIVYQPGLHFKLPFIDSVKKFDFRLKTMDVQSSRILTKRQKYVLVDYYVKWRISDLPQFYKSTHGRYEQAERLLQQKINDALRAAFGDRKIMEVVAGERVDIMNMMQEQAEQSAKNLGVKIIDVKIKRIDLPDNVSKSVFNRMRTERQQFASLYRSQGEAKAEKVKAQADRKASVIVAEAKRKAASIRAEGSQKAASVYADAYSQMPDFYRFYRAMQAYKEVFGHDGGMMLLTPNSEFMHYFKDLPQGKGKMSSQSQTSGQ